VRSTGGAGVGTLFEPDRSDERALRKKWGEHESLSVQKVTRWESEAFVFTAGLPCLRIMTAKWEPGLLSSY
jgi:hypothetical protein